MNEELLKAVRAANREFGEFARIASGPDSETANTIDRLSFVQLRLKHVSRCLAAGNPWFDPSIDSTEIQRYRENLKTLQDVLQTLQASLFLKKSRLNKARSNVQAARAWAESVTAYS